MSDNYKNKSEKLTDDVLYLMAQNVENFCKNVDPTRYILCQRTKFDGTFEVWFEPKEVNSGRPLDEN